MKGFWAICAVTTMVIACAAETHSVGTTDAGSGGSGNPGGSGGSSGSGGSAGIGMKSGGTAGVGGSSGGAGDGGRGKDCVVTDDHADIRSAAADGGTIDPGRTDVFAGKVVSVQPDGFEVDVCASSDAACAEQRRSVGISAPDLDLTTILGVGDLVRVHFSLTCIIGCFPTVLVTSEPSIGDLLNPHPAASGVYVAASEGLTTTFAEGGFTVAEQHVDCHFETTGSSCGDPQTVGAYALHFTDVASARSTLVSMGQTSRFVLRGQSVMIHDLRSYQSGVCDGFDDAYWLATPRESPGADR